MFLKQGTLLVLLCCFLHSVHSGTTTTTTATTTTLHDPITLTSTTSPDYGGTLSILCHTDRDYPTRSIELGKGAAPAGRYMSSRILATIGVDNQISNHGSNNNDNIGIDGSLDRSVAEASFLKVDIHDVGCANDGQFYCKVTSMSGTSKTVSISVSVCGTPSHISITKPQPSEPTHFIVICDVSDNMTSVENVTYMALSRRLRSSNTALEPIAFVSVAENGGRAQAFQNFTENHVQISGRINESDPVNSKLEAEFNPGSCTDAGEYTCTLVYSESGSDGDRLAMTRETLNSACDPDCLTATLKQSDRYDPTHFRVTCSRPDSYSYSQNCLVSSVLDQEISVLKTSYPQRQQVAYFDRYSSAHSGILHPDYRGRSAFLTESSTSELSVKINDGTCSDAGTYRCKVVYIRSDTHLPDSFISETTLPSCAPGAVVSVTAPHRLVPKFTCKADPSLVSKLLSLEVSAVVNGNRTVIAFLHSYLNNGKPEKQVDEGQFSVAGHIDPDNAEKSFLSLTSSWGSNATEVITSCKAVYQSVGDGKVVESFADHSFESLF